MSDHPPMSYDAQAQALLTAACTALRYALPVRDFTLLAGAIAHDLGSAAHDRFQLQLPLPSAT